MRAKVSAVLQYMTTQKINLPIFLDALSWGHEDCQDDSTISNVRTLLMLSKELDILERWWKPPKGRNTVITSQSAMSAFKKVSLQCIADTIDEEMKEAKVFLQNKKGKISAEHLQSVSFDDIIMHMKTLMPMVWFAFTRVAEKEDKARRLKRTLEQVSFWYV